MKLDPLFEGQVGEFYSLDDEFEPPSATMRGFVRKNPDNLIELHTVDEDDETGLIWSEEDGLRATPRYVAGLTASGGILLLRPNGSSRSKSYGGHRASTRKFRFRTVVAGVLTPFLRSGKIRAAELHFADMLGWAQMPVISRESERRDNGRLKSVTITLDAKDRRDTARLYDGFRIEIAPHWTYVSDDAYSRIETPLSVRVFATQPQPIEKFVTPLMDFRLLLSLAHGTSVPVDAARALVDYVRRADELRDNWLPMWDQRIMEQSDSRLKSPQHKFSYEALGGVRGVARWMKFSDDHGRFIRSVTMRPLMSGMTVTTRLMELYAAIEYYVAVGRRGRKKWAPKGVQPKARIIANLGGREFEELVGNVGRWADVIHWMNN